MIEKSDNVNGFLLFYLWNVKKGKQPAQKGQKGLQSALEPNGLVARYRRGRIHADFAVETLFAMK
jgi:hypothetical protein